MVIRSNSELLAASLESMEDLFYIFTPDGSFVDWNETLTAVTGYTDEELPGLHPTDLVADSERKRMSEALDTVTRDLTAVTVATVLETKSGDHIPYEFRWAPVESEERTDKAVVSIGREIDDNKRTQRKVEQRYQRYRVLAENFPNGSVFLFDGDMRLEIAQGKGLEAAEIDLTDIEGQRVGEVFDDLLPPQFTEMCRAALDGRSQTNELEFNDRIFRVYTVPVGEVTDSAQSGVAMMQDVTELKNGGGKSKRIDQFTNVVSHDLRNPLNVAQGRVTLAQKQCDSEHLEKVESALDRMETLIEDVLTLSRLGTVIGDRESVGLSAMINDCWATVDSGEATLTTSIDRTIEADESRLRQVFENLFRNAIEHGGDDVTVTVGDLDGGFYIEDDGPGIPEDARSEVFGTGYSTREEGTGFGLKIVKEIVNAHDWGIHLPADQQGGARFEITGVNFVAE